MDVVRPLVRVDRLEVHDVPNHVILIGNPVPAEHVTRLARDLERLAARVPLDQRDHLGGRLALVLKAAHLEARLQADGDLGRVISELLLDELVLRERPPKLLAVDGVLAGHVHARLGGAERAPRDAVARVVEAAKGALEALDVGEKAVLAHVNVVHEDLAGHRRAQGKLALDRRRGEAGHAALKQKAAEAAVVRARPHDKDVGDGRVGDPRLGAVQDVAAAGKGAGGRLHASGIAAVVGLGKAKGADKLAAR